MTQSDTTETSDQNFVGNECTNTSFLHGQFALNGAKNIVYANNILGVIIPASSGELADSSYYLSGKPDFWTADEHWPDIGPPNKPGTGVIPAKQRYESGGLLTVCPEAVTAVRKHLAGDAAWYIGPNPVRGDLYISAPAVKEPGTFIVRIFNIQGKLLSTKEYQKENAVVPLDKNWKSGVYLLEISSKKGRFLKKIILVR